MQAKGNCDAALQKAANKQRGFAITAQPAANPRQSRITPINGEHQPGQSGRKKLSTAATGFGVR